jgi:Aspartyl/Asparaginyl beta-hydroxylase
MKLQASFVQLPLRFDAERLSEEVASVSDGAWMPHPAGYEGNDFLPLIAAHGDPKNESFSGPMRPTPYLSAERPYLAEVLGSLQAVLGRTRFMRLSGHAEVSEHVDANYYWRDRVRVHVPIITQPTVEFHCRDAVVNMGAGECWIFDTWSLHKVINDAERSRVHLVADTVGGEGFWSLVGQGRATGFPAPPNWSPRAIPPSGAKAHLELENVNTPQVMSPWELRDHLNFLLAEAAPNQPVLADVARATTPFLQAWRATWSAHGDAEIAWPRYRRHIEEFLIGLKAARAEQVLMRNEVDFLEALIGMALSVASPGVRRQAAASSLEPG